MNVFIDGDKSGFKSKSAIDKFKTNAKNGKELSHFLQDGYEFVEKERTSDTLKYTIQKVLEKPSEKPSDKPEKVFNKKELFNAKLKLLADKRTNINVRNLSLNKDVVPTEVRDAYVKLVKHSTTTIPEPIEILKNPEQYKPIILHVLKNNTNQHKYYLDYFRLLAKHLGITPNAANVPNVANLANLANVANVNTKLNTIEDTDVNTESDTDL